MTPSSRETKLNLHLKQAGTRAGKTRSNRKIEGAKIKNRTPIGREEPRSLEEELPRERS